MSALSTVGLAFVVAASVGTGLVPDRLRGACETIVVLCLIAAVWMADWFDWFQFYRRRDR